VEFNNEQDISNKVLTLLKSKRLRNKYGLEGNLKVLHYYTWERIAAQTHELYNKFEKRGEEP
jgi:glycosyltransferase involved in cell wall biosynthesis